VLKKGDQAGKEGSHPFRGLPFGSPKSMLLKNARL
jgi:hypothetical protein